MYDVLVAGEINPDLILSGDVVPRFGQVEQQVDRALLTVGSSSAIFACGAARLGLRTSMIGVCGDDLFGRFMREELQARGVDTGPVIIRPGGRTGLSVILSRDSDRAILTFPGLIGALQETDVNDAFLSAGRHLHVASYFLQTGLQPNLESLFRRARTLGLTTSLDTNYDPSERWGDLAPVLSWTSVFMPNEREALALSGAADADAALRWLNSRVETVAIKLGSRGAIGGRNGMSVRAASISAHVVDTVGAGDAFDAGFLYGHLHGWDLAKSLQLACACGGLSTQRPGGVDGQPTIEEALQHVPG